MISPRETTRSPPAIDPGAGSGRFADRRDAGKRLAHALAPLIGHPSSTPLVLALPRGGVPVAYEVARALAGQLELLLVRKIGAPGMPEFGIGAVVDGPVPQVVLNDNLVERFAVSPEYLASESAHQIKEMARRRSRYCGDRKPVQIRERTVVVVDDGIATGSTMAAALQACRQQEAARLLFAAPCAPHETFSTLLGMADDGICLLTPQLFRSVGDFYDDFTQTADEEVIALLNDTSLPHGLPQ
jgi:putative phosphoribosyl transferase